MTWFISISDKDEYGYSMNWCEVTDECDYIKDLGEEGLLWAYLPLTVSGKTYAERKENLRQLAVEIQLQDCGGLSYEEEAILCDFFKKQGKRYGLLREFEENGII